MKRNKKISVIVPVYNCEDYIYDCINSIIRQSFEDFELILLNDGSTDNSLNVCRSFVKDDKRILLVSHENMGVSLTRKKGVELSNGEYITFIDADDSIEEDYLETLYNAMTESEADIVCCNSKDDTEADAKAYILEKEYITDKKTLLEAYCKKKRYAYCIWAKLYKREVLKGVEFPDMKYAEDAYVVLETFSKSKAVQLITYNGYHYTDNPTGAMSKSKSVMQVYNGLQCDLFMLEQCDRNATELMKKAQKKFVNGMFSVIAVKSELNISDPGVEKILNDCYEHYRIKDMHTGAKGKIVAAYRDHAEFIGRLLRIYRQIKYFRNKK